MMFVRTGIFLWPFSVLAVSIVFGTGLVDANLTCYQCTRSNNIPCGPETLLPCSSTSDLCVTHITKDAERGLTIKRECGLGPCGFDDDNINRGMGFGSCDRTKDDYFCVFCCKGNGCNKNNAQSHKQNTVVLSLLLTLPFVFQFLQIYYNCQR